MEETSPNQSEELDPDPERPRIRSKLPDDKLTAVEAFVYHQNAGKCPKPFLEFYDDLARITVDNHSVVILEFRYKPKTAGLTGISTCISRETTEVPANFSPEFIGIKFKGETQIPDSYYIVFRNILSDSDIVKRLRAVLVAYYKTKPQADLITELLRFSRQNTGHIFLVTLYQDQMNVYDEYVDEDSDKA